jgi:peptidyl-prolyl cis-trans isomerase SurA
MQKILTHLTRPMSRLLKSATALALAGTMVVPAAPVLAQGLFAPAIRVNQDVITRYELEQRILFMEVLRIPGDAKKEARKTLIDESLKRQVLAEVDFAIAPEDVQLGIDDFAARGQMSAEEFLKAVGQAGISEETVRDFVSNQLSWRDYISARFLSRARPTEEEIDRALGESGGGGLRVLLSEIIIPVTPQTLDQVDQLAQEIAGLKSYDAFSSAAAQYSASETKSNGGRMDWLSVGSLPPSLQPVILALNPGEISAPISLPNAVALFQMRGLQEVAGGAPKYASIEYATYFIPGGRSSEAQALASKLRQTVDSCDDLYGIAKGQPEQVLDRVTAKPSEIPKDISLELAKLDPNEISTALTRNNGQTMVFLMLCGRTQELGEDTSRQDIANALTQRRLESFATSLLERLRADAVITSE